MTSLLFTFMMTSSLIGCNTEDKTSTTSEPNPIPGDELPDPITDPSQSPINDNNQNSGVFDDFNDIDNNDNIDNSTISPTYFEVSEFNSGPLSNYSIDIRMSFETEDVEKSGALFLFALQTDGQYIVCAYPCSKNNWIPWDPNATNVNWTMNGIKNHVGALDTGELNGASRVIYSNQLDVSKIVGFKIYAGYGLGNSPNEAVREMLNSNRFKLVFTIQ